MNTLRTLSSFIERPDFVENGIPAAVDLHLHTWHSDGTLSPSELVGRAASRGVATIAVTDHDGLGGIEEAINAGLLAGIRVLPGIEFSAGIDRIELPALGPQDAGREIYTHILGYGIDLQNQALLSAVKELRELRQKRNEALLTALQSIGCALTQEDLHQHPGQQYVGKPNFALALKKRGYIRDLKEAFSDGVYLRHPEARKVHREKIDAKEAIRLIREAGGEAVLAHPFKIGVLDKREEGYYDRLEVLLQKLQEWGLSGLECRYSSHTVKQEEDLIRIAKKRDLIITAGSDFHGPAFDKALDIGVVVSY